MIVKASVRRYNDAAPLVATAALISREGNPALEPENPLAVESHSIDFVPLSERYGTPRRLFTIWLSINLSIVCAAVGSLASTAGLTVGWTILGLALGNAIGTVFMAAHSAQGPHLGVPQMVQSRAQFGVLGAGLPLIAVVLTYTLYTAADGLLVEASIGELLSVGNTTALVLFGLVTLLIAYVGYELIHRLGVIIAVVSGLTFIVAAVALFAEPGVGVAFASAAGRGYSSAAFMLVMTQAAAWSLSFGPYVADYSRYLPPETGPWTTFWHTGLGCFLGTTLVMAFGVCLGFASPKLIADPATAMAAPFTTTHSLMRALIVLGVLEGNVMNLYSAYMSTATIFSGLRHMRRLGKPVKLLMMTTLIAAATALSIVSQDDFQTYFGDILSVMIYLLVPWSAINLADYYLVRKGVYVVADFFRQEGQYGAFRWHTILVYVLGVAIQVPFMSLSFFEGPVAHALGADLAWLPGLLLPGAFYVLAERRVLSSKELANAR
jgi:NCS1 family nucleobase:cation symporter-1